MIVLLKVRQQVMKVVVMYQAMFQATVTHRVIAVDLVIAMNQVTATHQVVAATHQVVEMILPVEEAATLEVAVQEAVVQEVVAKPSVDD
jgi:hypothetical protein